MLSINHIHSLPLHRIDLGDRICSVFPSLLPLAQRARKKYLATYSTPHQKASPPFCWRNNTVTIPPHPFTPPLRLQLKGRKTSTHTRPLFLATPAKHSNIHPPSLPQQQQQQTVRRRNNNTRSRRIRRRKNRIFTMWTIPKCLNIPMVVVCF